MICEQTVSKNKRRSFTNIIAAHNSDLMEVIHAQHMFSEDLWLVSHTDLVASSRIRVVADFLLEIIAEAHLV